MCKYKFDMKQMREFLKDRRNCRRDFLRKQIKLLKMSEKFGNGTDIRRLEAR